MTGVMDSDPFDVLSPGRHMTDGGKVYHVGDAEQTEAVLAELFARTPGVVAGAAFKMPGQWPSILVEYGPTLRPALPADQDEYFRFLDGVFAVMGRLGWAVARTVGSPPEADRAEYRVQTWNGPRRSAGIYGPPLAGTNAAWNVMSPVPDLPDGFVDVVEQHYDGRVALYLSPTTDGVSFMPAAQQQRRLAALAQASLLLVTQAVLLPEVGLT
jgi:hypothetical protein